MYWSIEARIPRTVPSFSAFVTIPSECRRTTYRSVSSSTSGSKPGSIPMVIGVNARLSSPKYGSPSNQFW
jgi:hypothetical protein